MKTTAMKKIVSTSLMIAIFSTLAFSQSSSQETGNNAKDKASSYKFSVNTTWLSFANFGPEKTNTHHYEIHLGYKLTPKDKIGIKTTTWELFAPMGIPIVDAVQMKESTFFPGKLHEKGIGVIYQRMLWKGLFAAIEIMPLKKTYFDVNNKKIGNGFKLYTTYHLGYHIPLFKNRMYIEPQVHCNYWPIDTNAPQSFQAEENKWNNYMLFEPNLYIGINF
ncbi:MAG: hypothetical protein IPH69_12510 [Bacteroidales bacterium]|nr:hypothetical protein [Bacteroidales bacterium]